MDCNLYKSTVLELVDFLLLIAMYDTSTSIWGQH